MPLKSAINQTEGSSFEADANTTATMDNPKMVPPPPPPRQQPLAPGPALIPALQPDVLPPGILRFPPLPPPPPPNMQPPLSTPGIPSQMAPPGVTVPFIPRPPYGPPPGPPPMMRPPLPPGPPPLQEDAAIWPPVPQKPSYVKSAASTVVKRLLAQHTPELTAMVSLAFPISPFLFTSTLKTTLLCLLSVLHYRRKNYMVEISLFFFLFFVFFFCAKVQPQCSTLQNIQL